LQYDDGNPETTNLFLGNVSPIVREDTLYRLFRPYGSVLSVKIMWPRTPEEFARGHNRFRFGCL
jgi:U2-associated protein SR140